MSDSADFVHETREDGTVVLGVSECTFTFTALVPGVIFTRVRGYDRGWLGRAPLEVVQQLAGGQPFAWFFDTREATGVATRVRQQWTEFFSENRRAVRRVAILVNSKGLELTLSVAELLSGVNDLFQLYQDPAKFLGAIRREVPDLERLPD